MKVTSYFPDVQRMPDFPALPVPSLHELNERFRTALMDEANGILRRDTHGNPIFGAYIGSSSNELITWSIITLGEWLSNRDASWLTGTWSTFFSPCGHVYLNSPGGSSSELWYLFYGNTLSSALQQALFREDPQVRFRFAASADALFAMARALDYDFDHQTFHFDTMRPSTRRDAYRQPDSSGGYAYNMLFAALHADRPQYMEESLRGIRLYQSMPANPWYEIPNGSAALMAAAWLDAHGHPCDIDRIAGWLFDHDHGPLQTGVWGGEQVDGLMMGWRGDTREDAMASAYSMETFMPLQFFLPAVRYCPQLADATAKYVRCMLSNFQLFYGRGSRPLYETRPNLDACIPYERLVRELDGHSPAATGDFAGQRSVYGSGYLMWLEAMTRETGDGNIFALDLSLTDWLADDRYPVFLLRNPCDQPRQVAFTPAPVWERIHPELFRDGRVACVLHDLDSGEAIPAEGQAVCTVPAHGCTLAALLPEGMAPERRGSMLCCGQAELLRLL